MMQPPQPHLGLHDAASSDAYHRRALQPCLGLASSCSTMTPDPASLVVAAPRSNVSSLIAASSATNKGHHVDGSVHFAAINGGGEKTGTRFQCPITRLEFDGKYKFVAMRGCGHVVSAKAMKEVKSSGCLVCHAEFLEEDKIVINGNDKEVAALRERMEAEKAKATRVKKAKKTKIEDGVANGGEEEVKTERREAAEERERERER